MIRLIIACFVSACDTEVYKATAKQLLTVSTSSIWCEPKIIKIQCLLTIARIYAADK